jgi:hypothetical protein
LTWVKTSSKSIKLFTCSYLLFLIEKRNIVYRIILNKTTVYNLNAPSPTTEKYHYETRINTNSLNPPYNTIDCMK